MSRFGAPVLWRPGTRHDARRAMCSFLTVGIEAARAGALETVLRAQNLGVSAEVNPHVKPLFPQGDVLFLVTRGDCSCDLVPLKADSPREEKRRRRGQAGAKKPNQFSDALFAALRAHAPMRMFFHEVDGDHLTGPVAEGARATLVSSNLARRDGA